MKIKHSKYRNTGLIFEILVKQVAADTLAQKDSPAISIIRKFFTGKSSLVGEYKLYEILSKQKAISQNKAELVINTLLEVGKKLDQKALKSRKYELIAEISKHYNLEDFFGTQVKDYKVLAAFYCLLESYRSPVAVDPVTLLQNRVTLVEHCTASKVPTLEETAYSDYKKADADIRLLAFRFLLEKFNRDYKHLLPEQKELLRQVLTAVDSKPGLRMTVNEESSKIKGKLEQLITGVKDDIVKIKLQEVLRNIKPIPTKEKVTDVHLVRLMQYYELLHELGKVV